MADNDDFKRVMARFPVASTMEAALRLHSDKNVIVFVQVRRMHNFIHWLCDNYDVDKVIKARNVVILDDGREIVFMNEYKKSWGFDRSKFVVVNYL